VKLIDLQPEHIYVIEDTQYRFGRHRHFDYQTFIRTLDTIEGLPSNSYRSYSHVRNCIEGWRVRQYSGAYACRDAAYWADTLEDDKPWNATTPTRYLLRQIQPLLDPETRVPVEISTVEELQALSDKSAALNAAADREKRSTQAELLARFQTLSPELIDLLELQEMSYRGDATTWDYRDWVSFTTKITLSIDQLERMDKAVRA
jgi:hypothetical protein